MRLPTVEIDVVDHIKAGAYIRKTRTTAGMSLRRLAKEMGFTAPFVSDLERGRRSWSEKNFDKAQIAIVEWCTSRNRKAARWGKHKSP